MRGCQNTKRPNKRKTELVRAKRLTFWATTPERPSGSEASRSRVVESFGE